MRYHSGRVWAALLATGILTQTLMATSLRLDCRFLRSFTVLSLAGSALDGQIIHWFSISLQL